MAKNKTNKKFDAPIKAGGIIKGVRIYTTAAALTAAVVKLPDASYEVMRAYAEDLQRG